jgi:GAF domain-containing protein/two-component sensor histidine kinase
MAYLLLLPITFYITLTTIVVYRQPRSISSAALAIYILSAAIGTGGYLVLGTTSERRVAEIAFVLVVLVSSWAYLVFFPLTLLSMYFESWVQRHRKPLLAASLLLILVGDSVMLGVMLTSVDTLVTPVATGFETNWQPGYDALPWWLVWLLLAVSQTGVLATLGAAVAKRRLAFWRGAIPFFLVSLLSYLIPVGSSYVSDNPRMVIAAMGFVPPVMLLTGLVLRVTREIPLETLLGSAVNGHNDGMIVLDADRNVVWMNTQLNRWLGTRRLGGVGPTHIFELLRDTPLILPTQHVLDTEAASDEFEVQQGEEDYVLRVDLRPLDHVRYLSNAQLLCFRDITTSRIRRDLEERSRELMALSAISADIASSLDTHQVITRALQQVLAVTQAGNAVVYLLDDHHPDQLKLAGSLFADGKQQPVPATNSIENSSAGYVVKTRRPLFVPDVRTEPVHGSRLLALGSHAGVSIPLIARDRVIGVLQIGYPQPHDFGAIEVALLESVCRQLAVALENAHLHHGERQQRHVAETLRAVSTLLNNKNFDEALENMLHELSKILDYDRASLLLVDTPDKLRIGAQVGFEIAPGDDALKDVRIPITSYPYLVKLFDQQQPQLVLDTTTDPEWRANDYGYRSWMGVPLVSHEQIFGCLTITHSQPQRFTPDDLQTAQSFANQAVITVENAQLFATEQRQRMQAERLQQASYDLATSRDLNRALHTSLNHLAHLLPFDQAHIGLVDASGETWVSLISYPTDFANTTKDSLLTADFPLIQHVLDQKRPVLVTDTQADPLWRPSHSGPNEIRCWLGAPLVLGNRVIGFLNIDSFTPNTFSEEQRQITQVFANQLAAAIENFRLQDEARRQNQALSAINTILAASNEALTHENILVVALERVLETLNLSGGAIHQRNASTGQLRLRAASGLPATVKARLDRLPAVTALPRGETYGFFCVPLVAHGIENGLLSIYLPHHEPLDENIQNLLKNIGQQLGVVMENATLFEQTSRREILSTDLSRLSLAISAQLDQDNVLHLICRESLGIFNVQGAYIWLLENNRLVGKIAYGPGAKQFAGHELDPADSALLPVRAIQERRPRYVNWVAQTTVLPPDLQDLTRAQAAIAVPMFRADVPIGAILLVNTEQPDVFADWIVDQIALLGVHTALALQNTALFEEIRRRLDQLRLVNEVGRYATAILNPQSLIEGVAKKLFDTLGYDLIGVLQVNEYQLTVHSIFAQNRPVTPASLGDHYTAPDSIPGQAVQRAEPVLKNQTCRRLNSERGEAASSFDCCSLAVPLIMADEVIGVLIVERKGHDTITKEDLDVLEPLSAQLAITVSNAGLFEKIRQQTLELEARVAERTTEIRRQHERTEAILRSVADAVIVFDLQGQVVLTNPVAKRLFDQYDLDMDLGARIHDLVARTSQVEGNRAPTTEVLELGPVALQAKAARVVEDSNVLGTVVVLRDISMLKELDRMKDKFVSTVSHELRTPVANLKLYLSLLQQGKPERQRSYFEVMEREIERLTRLIDELLQLSRLESEHRTERPRIRQPIDFQALIDTVIADNAAWAEQEQKHLWHECRTPPLPAGLGDPDQIVRALTNLVSNAINYTPAGGSITVRSWVDSSAQNEPEWVTIEVIDTGIGIPAHELPLIFERFYRGSNVEPNIPGTGLGLAIIKEIVELHGGKIVVESKEDEGSTFQMMLPVLTASNKALVGENRE